MYKQENENGVVWEIEKHIATISTNSRGWTKELNVISWHGRKPTLDLRSFSPEHDKLSKGVTLTIYEARNLLSSLQEYLKEGVIDG